MTLPILASCSISLILFTANAFAADQRGFTIEDLVKMERISAPALSPDGSKLLYQIRTTDLDKNHGHTELWLMDLANATHLPQRFSNTEANSSSAVWSARGDAIYFLSNRSGSAQVWRQSVHGGDASKVTDFPIEVASFRVAPTEDRIAVSLEVFRDCPDLACT
ncbi:MAG: PD40 domain-containing protein, partial [Cytophaga sp.]|nr:PD40 domain-containing protein [Undibacterium sp.]